MFSKALLPFFGPAPAPQCPFCTEVPKTEHITRGEASPIQLQGQDYFPGPAHHTIPDTRQDAIGLLSHLGTLLAYIQSTVHQYTKVPFHQPAFQSLFPKPVGLPGVVVTKVQVPVLGPIETHTVNLGSLIQSIQVPL